MRREDYEHRLTTLRVRLLQLLEERGPICVVCDDFGWVYDKGAVGQVFCEECNWPKAPKKPTRYDKILENTEGEP